MTTYEQKLFSIIQTRKNRGIEEAILAKVGKEGLRKVH